MQGIYLKSQTMTMHKTSTFVLFKSLDRCDPDLDGGQIVPRKVMQLHAVPSTDHRAGRWRIAAVGSRLTVGDVYGAGKVDG